MNLLDANGRPFDRQALRARQTADMAWRHAPLRPIASTLTPASLKAALAAADLGDLVNQHRLFEEMEDTDAHLAAEIGKRKMALLTLDWDIVPPPRASFQEKKAAAWLKDTLTDAVDPLDDLILALMDGPGHGFAAVELAWTRRDGDWLPGFLPRPQGWFRIDARSHNALRLADGSSAGAEPWPFGWILHTHGPAKTGSLARLGLYRALLWPWLYKHYSIGDLAEFIEAYGLPLILGRYHDTASEAEKASLLQAVVDLGHDARAIMPAQMAIDIQKVTSSGDGVPHLALIDWCERSESKLILGQVLSAEAKSTGLGSGLAEVHNEVRHDILESDARRIAATLTRDLCYPLLAINRGLDSLQRCPRFVFDFSQPEDLVAYANALPKLAGQGLRIPIEWVHDKLKIPLAGDGERILGVPPDTGPADNQNPPPPAANPATASALAALAAQPRAPAPADGDPTPASALADRLAIEAGDAWQAVVDHLETLVNAAGSLEELQQTILTAYAGLPLADLRAILAQGFAVGALAGLADVQDEAATGSGAAA